MTWTKIGSEFLLDPVILALPRGVRLVHLEALIWCNNHGTDGAVRHHMLGRVSDEPDVEQAAKLLVDAELWQTTDDGWLIVGFHDSQPSAADVEQQRRKAAERQRRRYKHNNGDHSMCDPKYCWVLQNTSRRESTRESGVDSRASVPYRPDPFRSVETKSLSDDGGDGRGGASGSMSRSAQAPPRPSPTARRGKALGRVGSADFPFPADGTARPCDFTVSTSIERDEHIMIMITADEPLGDAVKLLDKLASATRSEINEAKRKHGCPKAKDKNLRICKIDTESLQPDPEAEPGEWTPNVTFHVPAEFSQAWLDTITWELNWGDASGRKSR